MTNNSYVPKILVSKAGVMVATLSLMLVLVAPSVVSAEILTRQLEFGMTGNDVSAVQTFLAKDVSLYPQGLVTGYFGFLTKSAVANFQSRNGISAVGRIGPITLPVINAQMAGGLSYNYPNNATGDVYAPIISNVRVSAGRTNANITWSTNDAARGKMYYGTSPLRITGAFDQTGVSHTELTANGALAQYDGNYRTSHSVSLDGLTPNTTYYYLIEVLDSSNNESITLPASFTTSQ